MKNNNNHYQEILLAILMVFVAGIYRNTTINNVAFKTTIYLATMLFSIVVVFNWAISAYERIVVLEAKKYMGYIGMLMILWIFLRYTRFYLFDDYPAISTFLWYLYYFPFIFIPLYSFKLVQYFNYSYICT